MNDLKKMLHELRMSYGVAGLPCTLVELSNKLGISRVTIDHVRNGGDVSVRIARKIVDAYLAACGLQKDSEPVAKP